MGVFLKNKANSVKKSKLDTKSKSNLISTEIRFIILTKEEVEKNRSKAYDYVL